jgi:hypothetical protein
MSITCAQQMNGLQTMLMQHHILDNQQSKAIMTLSDHKGKQIIKDTIQECFLQDFRTILIVMDVLMAY